MSYCRRCGCDIGMAEVGCLSCDHETDWLEGNRPAGFKPMPFLSPLESMLTPMAREALLGRRTTIIIPWWAVGVAAVALGALIAYI